MAMTRAAVRSTSLLRQPIMRFRRSVCTGGGAVSMPVTTLGACGVGVEPAPPPASFGCGSLIRSPPGKGSASKSAGQVASATFALGSRAAGAPRTTSVAASVTFSAHLVVRSTHTPLYIDTPESARRFVHDIAATRELALDTEGASFHRFVDRIYLLQLSTRDQSAIIDPLAVGALDELGKLLEDPKIEIVFHD